MHKPTDYDHDYEFQPDPEPLDERDQIGRAIDLANAMRRLDDDEDDCALLLRWKKLERNRLRAQFRDESL